MNKQRKLFPHLDREVEEKIAKWFQEQELLYRVDSEGYSDKTKKDTAWAEGAQLIGIEEGHLRHFIRGQRTLFSKLVKPGKSRRRPFNLTGRKKWTLKNFEFLRNHIQHRRVSSSRGAKEEHFEEDDYDDDHDEILVAVDCASDAGELNQYGAMDQSSESINGLDDPSHSSTQRQVLKRRAELQNEASLNRLRQTQLQPIQSTVKRSMTNVSATWPQMDPPCPVFSNHPRGTMEEGGRENIRQFQTGESTNAEETRKGFDDQVKSFLEMIGTTMMSLNPKRRHKTQRKLLNLMFDELEEQEKEDEEQRTSSLSAANSGSTPPPPNSTPDQPIPEMS